MELLDFPDEVYRNFRHPDGRIVGIKVSDCRVVRNGFSSTKFSIADAQHTAAKKIKQWLRDGFIEVERTPGQQFDLKANIINAFNSVIGSKGGPKYNYLPVSGYSSVYRDNCIVIDGVPDFYNILLCSEDHMQAIMTRTDRAIFRKTMSPEVRDMMANEVIAALEGLKKDVLADRNTPVRKFRLKGPIGKFTHIVALSPVLYNFSDENLKHIGRSIWFAFLCFDSEFIDTDDVCLGEARYTGHASITYTDWDRTAHFVFDLRYVKDIKKPEKDNFLVYPPQDFNRRLNNKVFSKMKCKAIDARNYRGEIRRFLPNQILSDSDIEELHSFFGMT